MIEPAEVEVDGVAGKRHRTLACKECWDVWNITLSNHTGWNDFVM